MAALLGHHRQARVLAGNGLRDAEFWIEAVKHDIGTIQDRAPPATHQGTGRRVVAWPRAEGDVKSCLLKQGEVRDRQGGVVILDQEPGTAPGSAG